MVHADLSKNHRRHRPWPLPQAHPLADADRRSRERDRFLLAQGIWIATTVGLRLDRATAGLIAQGSFSLTARLRTIFALMLFIAWGIQTNLWVNDAFYFLAEGEPTRAIRATGTILLMIVLAGLEGLEVAVIDRWRDLYPQRSNSVLSNWLASRNCSLR